MATALNRDISIRIHKLTFMMDRLADQALRQHGDLTFSQLSLLMGVRRHGRLSQLAIAKFHGVTPAAVSRRVQDLVDRKFVHRTINQKNRREHILTLTKAGEQRLDRMMELLDQHLTPYFQTVPLAERKRLSKLLDRLWKSFEPDHVQTHKIFSPTERP